MLRIAFHNKRKSGNSQDTTYTFPGNLPKLSVNRLICELSRSCPQKHNKIAWVTQRPTQSPIRSPLEQGQTDRLAQGGDLSSRHVGLSAARPAPSHTSQAVPSLGAGHSSRACAGPGAACACAAPRPAPRRALTASGLGVPAPRVAEAFGAPCCQPPQGRVGRGVARERGPRSERGPSSHGLLHRPVLLLPGPAVRARLPVPSAAGGDPRRPEEGPE